MFCRENFRCLLIKDCQIVERNLSALANYRVRLIAGCVLFFHIDMAAMHAKEVMFVVT